MFFGTVNRCCSWDIDGTAHVPFAQVSNCGRGCSSSLILVTFQTKIYEQDKVLDFLAYSVEFIYFNGIINENFNFRRMNFKCEN